MNAEHRPTDVPAPPRLTIVAKTDPIVWEDPPAPNTWDERLAPLRTQPGRWAKYGPFSASGIHNIRRYLERTRPGFEYLGRRIDGEGFIYARFPASGDPTP